MNLNQYLVEVNKLYQSGISSEHAYRPDFRDLINELASDITITNEPSNVTDCGNPDYVITKGKIPIGFIEAKDVGKDLNSKQYKEQFDRYRKALDNLIITDYIWFQFFQNDELIHEIRIAEIKDNKIEVLPDNLDEFTNLVKNFCSYVSQTIKSPKRLAELMAAKARLLENILEKAITSDEETEENSALEQQYKTFKDVLIHDLTPQEFSDIYSQTLAYGMFAARLHDDTLADFSRQEAAELIPKTNPFLRKLFSHVAGVDIDERIVTTVDNLADVFRATNVEELLKNFGKGSLSQDPIIHFYETFLAEYDPKLRKSRGVWYTPEPVVSFIVRSVDEILKTEFNLKDGLADTSKTIIQEESHQIDARTKTGVKKVEKEVHKVQILDPATGTGTFLAEVVKFIYNKKFSAMQGIWSSYVEEELIPRLNGFELLMASYSMAHLKLDLLLSETGYKPKKNKRFNIFLTNSLEEHHPDTGTLFSTWLSSEANEANYIKRDTPVMVVMGNPPYSGASANKGDWIMELMNDYKKEPGGKEKLNERNPKWLNDDYVKFIRYGQYFIEKNGIGIMAYINPHGYLDNPTFRGMRWNLLKTFDKIYTIDLHGNSKKKEVSPDGKSDVNVFDIQQGVSINFFIKNGQKKNDSLGEVFHYDLWGDREKKYEFLKHKSLRELEYNKIENVPPQYFMTPKNYVVEEKYRQGFRLNDLFTINVMGFQTHRDHFAIAKTEKELRERINELLDDKIETKILADKYSLKDVGTWNLDRKRTEISKKYIDENISQCAYRLFDNRFVYMDKAINDRPRLELGEHVVNKDNICLLVSKQQSTAGFQHCFVTKYPANDCVLSSKSREGNQVFPLFIYMEDIPAKGGSRSFNRVPNFNDTIIKTVSRKIGLSLSDTHLDGMFTELDLLDYIYSILHSSIYRKTYEDFLKVDFPIIPYPNDSDTFFQFAKLGKELRQIHLFESKVIENLISRYPVDGDNEITRKIVKKDWDFYDPETELGRIWINEDQYFDKIPLTAWEFNVGGYQPAQKWLKDRFKQILSFDDILHYQKIIVSLMETDRIMNEINKIDFD